MHVLLLLLIALPCLAAAEETGAPGKQPGAAGDGTAQRVQFYRNPEERREAGLGTRITDWLRFSGLLELEKEYQRDVFRGGLENTDSERIKQALQLGFEIEWGDWLEAEFVFEAENDNRYRSRFEEAMVGFDVGDWGIKVGKQSLPFGEYYSHFVTGPLLEFGETIKPAVIVDYSVNAHLEVAAFFSESEGDRARNAENTDWGAAFELVSADESVRFGASYFSDLSEADEQLVEHGDLPYQSRVPAWSAYLLVGLEHFEFTAETVNALRSFRELEPPLDRPGAWNLEAVYFPADTLQVALRVERSRELEEAAARKYGLAATWRPGGHVAITVEYLYGVYKSGFFEDDDGNEASRSHQMAAQLSYEF